MPPKKKRVPLSETHPNLAEEAYGWNPREISHGSNRKLDWRCKKGHIFSAAPGTRTKQQSGCPICSNHQVLEGFNDLATTHPHIANDAYEWNPRTVTYGNGKKVAWKCSEGHIYTATINSRTSQGSGCTICANRIALAGYNDLATTHPDLALEAFGWDPTTLSAGVSNKVGWKCQLGHTWTARVYSRTSKKPRGCPICSNQVALPGFNDLATIYPEIAREAYGWDSRNFTKKSTSKKKWICPKQHIYEATIQNRTSKQGSDCPYCANRKVLVGFNDLLTTHPDLAEQADGWNPKEFTSGYGKKQEWVCPDGHRWKVSISSRTTGGTGCPSCAKHGFNPGKKGYFYLLHNPQWKMFQIGITNDIDRRIKEHRKKGWLIQDIRGPIDGHLTQQWEAAILRMLQARGADLANDKVAGKFDGYSEAWSKNTFEAASIKELMELTEEFEQSNEKNYESKANL